jgi:hypothetical protein
MIWLWRNPKTLSQNRMGKYIQDSGTDRFEFRKCVILDPDSVLAPKVVFSCDEKYLLDVLPNSGALLIVSRKVLGILSDICPNDYQVFDANVFVGDKSIEGYSILNILNQVEVFDMEKCLIKKYMGTITSIEKIIYKTDNLFGHDIALNAEFTSHVLVSDRIKEAFEKNKIKRVEFREGL